MLSLGMSEFTANSVSYSYFSTGVLVAHITDKMVSSSAVLYVSVSATEKQLSSCSASNVFGQIPAVSPLRLNTSSFGKLIPQVNTFSIEPFNNPPIQTHYR